MEPKVLVPEKYGRAFVAPVYREEVATDRVGAEPPTKAPHVPPALRPDVAAAAIEIEVVPTDWIELLPLPYKSWPAVYVAGVYGPTRDRVTAPVEAEALI